MNNENSTKVIFGKGCVKEYLRCLLGHYGDTVMLAYGGGSIKQNGVYDEILSVLADAGKNVVEFSGIMPNPTDCNHGAGLAVLHPVYYRKICEKGAAKFARFATRVWDISAKGKSEKALAKAGVEALADFIRELGLPTTLRELGVAEDLPLEEIANSVPLTPGGYGKLTHKDVLDIFKEAL